MQIWPSALRPVQAFEYPCQGTVKSPNTPREKACARPPARLGMQIPCLPIHPNEPDPLVLVPLVTPFQADDSGPQLIVCDYGQEKKPKPDASA